MPSLMSHFLRELLIPPYPPFYASGGKIRVIMERDLRTGENFSELRGES